MKKCKKIMTTDVICCYPNDTAYSAANLMKKNNIGILPVVDSEKNDEEGRNLVGIITDRDLALRLIAENLNAKKTKVAEIMTSQPITCRENDSIKDVLDTMKKHQVRRILAIDNNDRLVGIIAEADIALRLGKPKKTGEVVAEISKAFTASAVS
jgi:CBS domain-containing protein